MVKFEFKESGYTGVLTPGELYVPYDVVDLSGKATSCDVPEGSNRARLLMLGGNSAAYNMMFSASYAPSSAYGITLETDTSTNTITINGSPTQNAAIDCNLGVVQTVGHIMYGYGYNSEYLTTSFAYGRYTDRGDGVVYQNPSTTTHYYISVVEGAGFGNVKLKPRLFDMTKMFGVTTVDAVTDDMKALCKSLASVDDAAYSDGTIKSAAVSAVNFRSEAATEIPDTITGLPGYGMGISDTVRNYIDFKNKKYVQMVGYADLSKLSWVSETGYNDYTHWKSTSVSNLYCPSADVTTGNISPVYIETTANEMVQKGYVPVDNSIAFAWNSIYVYNGSTTSSPTGAIVYRLASPVTTDISSCLTDDLLAYNSVKYDDPVTFVTDTNVESYYKLRCRVRT